MSRPYRVSGSDPQSKKKPVFRGSRRARYRPRSGRRALAGRRRDSVSGNFRRELPEEIARFESALIATRAELLEIQQRIADAIGTKDAGIFDAHLSSLKIAR